MAKDWLIKLKSYILRASRIECGSKPTYKVVTPSWAFLSFCLIVSLLI